IGLLMCLALLQTQWGRRHLALIFLGVAWSVPLTFHILLTQRGQIETNYYLWMMPFFALAAVVPVRWRLHLAAQLGIILYYVGVNLVLGNRITATSGTTVDLPEETYLTLFWFCFVCNLSVFMYERLARTVFKARQVLIAEQEKSERLLLNILPHSIAERLKHQSDSIADNFTEVTVLFADIVGFTQLSAQMSPEKLVNLLNQVFSLFDQLAARHNLEKIKTIGDAYMVVAGLPEARANHVAAIADMALEMQQSLILLNQQIGQTLNIRVGIHTGPVVAGVIGLKKFAYDLWGDTVNTASRMESSGIPGEIQVTQITYDCLKQDYRFEERGTIPIKGKGDMTTYLLKGRSRIQGAVSLGRLI
ncbi:MAG: adenylate/guanylate cyclase domain-containing protein, partial [Leptolyngbyaceae cyanobacterium CAN_BIN12]|nr:adenylate/guanylate cyclase domain-containing protein [Leptolyngbyaceae cyanobacterium CAN_BIN12]